MKTLGPFDGNHFQAKRGNRQENVRSAAKKPEMYTTPDGKKGVRMVPVNKEIIKKESLNPRIVDLNMDAAKKEINKAINFCKVASGKHADKSAKMKANKAIKSLNQALKDLG